MQNVPVNENHPRPVLAHDSKEKEWGRMEIL
jgi:hypothetical protein